ncbi:MAG: hypothetical protein F6K48_03245 [Okeania sp. SIO3H1]|nr:hypothetical protein [Okeania sp. SIO3H1]
MSRNDWNYTCAAAAYGAICALMPTPIPDDAEPDSDESKDAVMMPASWAEASSDIQQDVLNGIGFLARYLGTSDPVAVDRDAAGMALATQLKGSGFAAFKPNYAVFISVFISTRQAYGL